MTLMKRSHFQRRHQKYTFIRPGKMTSFNGLSQVFINFQDRDWVFSEVVTADCLNITDIFCRKGGL